MSDVLSPFLHAHDSTCMALGGSSAALVVCSFRALISSTGTQIFC